MKEPTPKDETKPESTKEEHSQDTPIDISKVLGAAKEFMPGIADMLKPKKKDTSTMCEFTIKGSDEFVINCLSLILGK